MSSAPPPNNQPPPWGPPPQRDPNPKPEGYQPFQQYYSPTPQPKVRQRRQGLVGWLTSVLLALWAFVKYGGLLLLKFGFLKTLITLAISFGAYAIFYGPWFAAGLVLMILVHEMGHVLEIRRQGMQATAPLFIPFFGAAIFQRTHATDALHQAQIGIAGPLAGTIGATAAFVLYGATHNEILLLWAYLGFFINLFNMIPVGMLDGGWILGVVSKWFQLFGLGLLILAVFFIGFSPIVLIIVIFGLPTLIDRFRNDRSAYYQSVPMAARYAMGSAWVLLTAYLAFAMFQAHGLLQGIVR